MKRTINSVLKRAGWELQRIRPSPANGTAICEPPSAPPRPTMRSGLEWLGVHQFPIKTVLDVGASNGCWSRDCMSFFPEAKYVLFEPQPVHSEALDAFAQSCSQSVVLVKKAVGASVGHTFFNAADPFGGALARTDDGNSIIKVPLTTIDATTALLRTEGPYLLKLDTHGFEKSILDGAANTLREADILIIEAYNYRISDEALLFWELCAYLSDRGFRPIDLVDVLHRTHDNSFWQMDLAFIRSTWQGFDYVSYK